MTQRIFITATNTDIGKTYTTEKLLRYYASKGLRVGVFKPIETGVSDRPLDGTLLLETVQQLNPEFRPLQVSDIVPIQFPLPAAPYVANGAKPIDFSLIDTALASIEARCDVLLIEGAGGLLVPLDHDHKIIDLIQHFKAKTLLVSHCRLGCINDTLLNLLAMDARELDYLWILNQRQEDTTFDRISKPFFIEQFGHAPTLQKHLPQIADRLLDPKH